MPEQKRKAALFDLDGVVIDTESQYSIIWGRIGKIYHPEMPDFAYRIKGMTLVNIFREFFDGDAEAQEKVTKMLDDFEADEMVYTFIPGAREYIEGLRAAGIKTALATSSNLNKMADVKAKLPELFTLFDEMVTAEITAHSKPAPDCFLKGAELLGVSPEECVVFEDSKNGIRAGRAAQMLTIGVCTTFPEAEIAPLASTTIDTFVGLETNRFF